MDFAFSPEQTLLRDNLRRLIARSAAFGTRRATVVSADGFDRQVWAQFAELGLTALGAPERYGGLGATDVETLLVMEEIGRGILLSPFLSNTVVAAHILAGGAEGLAAQWLPAMVAGEQLVSLAHGEPDARYDPTYIGATAVRSNDGWRLNGAKAVVPYGAVAERLIVSARPGADASGVLLLLVDPNAAGVARKAYATHDGGRAADFVFADVAVGDGEMIAEGPAAQALVEGALDRGVAAICAEAVGAMDALIALTLDYVKTRQQFRVPIGSFQVVQHRLADMLLNVELARSMTYFATAKVGEVDALERRRALAAAKSLVGRSARFVGQQAIQLHGGIGLTEEYAAGHYFKRLTLIDITFGDAEHHLARFSDLMTA